jgi:DnaK suppressor protein
VSPSKLDGRITGELERFLHDELARLQGSLHAAVSESRTAESTSLTDMSIHAAETLHTEIQVTLLDRRTQQVVQIQDALARLSGGQYGFCQDCEEFIGVPRLRALPFAARCRDCQGQAERRARRAAPVAAREALREAPLEAA